MLSALLKAEASVVTSEWIELPATTENRVTTISHILGIQFLIEHRHEVEVMVVFINNL